MKRYCFALDLINDDELISSYKKHHKMVWPEIEKSIKESGVKNLEIYLVENRLFMILEANNNFSLEQKAVADDKDPRVQEWEKLMWKYQKALPTAGPNEKWLQMELIYKL